MSSDTPGLSMASKESGDKRLTAYFIILFLEQHKKEQTVAYVKV